MGRKGKMERNLQERVRHSRGRIAHIKNRVPYFASVEMTVCWPAQEFSVGFDCHGEGWQGQGSVEEVPAEGYDDWKQGALAGIRYALARCHALPCRITITRIVGMTTDTNPTIVGGAVIEAVWAATEYETSTAEKAFVEQQVFQSWTHPPSSIPDFGM